MLVDLHGYGCLMLVDLHGYYGCLMGKNPVDLSIIATSRTAH